jgi:ubiquinone/menaquinone biosynthesis C-methylase UbiE
MTAQKTQPAPAGPTDDAKRAQVRMMWAGVADRWRAHADQVDARGADLTRSMLGKAQLRRGDRVLELACGPGGAGLAAAEHVGPDGVVVLSDAVEEMADIAGQRAAARGLTNVRTATRDLEQIDEPDGAFDVVLCREGMMFAVDPRSSAREIRRVLRPGGRLVAAVWGPKVDNPWLTVIFEAVSAVIGLTVPPPGMPGPFALADAARLAGVVEDGGLEGVEIEAISVPLRMPTFEAWWSRTTAIAGPVAAIIAHLDAATASALEDHVRSAVQQYVTPDGLDFPGSALVVSARRS